MLTARSVSLSGSLPPRLWQPATTSRRLTSTRRKARVRTSGTWLGSVGGGIGEGLSQIKSRAILGTAPEVVKFSPAVDCYRKLSFQLRSAANTALGDARGCCAWISLFARTVVSVTRRKGLVASSSARVEGRVGNCRSRSAATSAARCCRAGLSGSTARAKRRLLRVYSWVQ
ncbi:hypothetical protein D3C80_1172540 [compost metagenome]